MDEQAMYRGTRITEPPTVAGPAAQAWRVRLPPIGQRDRPDFDATVDCYVVRAPGCHAFWTHWMLTVIHLRPIEGAIKPPDVRVPGATHEFLIVALNPEHALPSLDVTPGWGISYLTPVDVVVQFTAANDAVAAQVCELAVLAILNGQASPDQDYRAWWKQAIAETSQHFADGTHKVSLS